MASNAARGRNSPIKAHQINLKDRSSGTSISRFAVAVSRFEFTVGTRLLDLKSAATRFKQKNISATIVADVKRFSYQINTDEVFDTHRPRLGFAERHIRDQTSASRWPLYSIISSACCWRHQGTSRVKRLDFLEIDHLSLPKIISGRNDGATRVAPT
jgi:hypothetical protein